MARAIPRTRAGKQRKVARVLGEFKDRTLRSSAGPKVTNRKQAIAIALSEAGLSRPKSERGFFTHMVGGQKGNVIKNAASRGI